MLPSIKIRFSFEMGTKNYDSGGGRYAIMASEDDDLSEYESNKHKASEKNKLMSQRNDLLDKQSSNHWQLLRAEILKYCATINEKAGREILKSVTPRTPQLDIRREDGAKFEAEYNQDTRKVKFSSNVFLFAECEYEVVVRSINGSDTVVWFDLTSHNIETASGITKALFGRFMRARAD